MTERNRKPSNLIAAEEIAGGQYEVVVNEGVQIKTLAAMKKHIRDSGMVGRKFHIFRTSGETIEFKKVEKVVEA